MWGRLLLWLSAGLSGGLCPAQNTNPIVIGGFDANRSGQASFPDGAAFSQARTAILSHYPAASFAGFAELTASNLAGVQVLVVGSAAGSSSATSPLSAAEQTALLEYVQNGGAAMVFTDNESFAPEAAAANASLLAPFGLSGGGTVISEVVATPSDPEAHPLLRGPYGTVRAMVQFVPGAITNPGPHALSLATNYGGIALAVIDPGRLGPGSGTVVFFSDISGFWDTDGYFATNATLFLNAFEWARAPAVGWRLRIQRLGSEVLLRWPGSITNAILESTTNLLPGRIWTEVTNPPVLIGDENVVTNPAEGIRFYRLRGPAP